MQSYYQNGGVASHAASDFVFSEWDKIFKDAMTATAVVDRLVHRSIVLEFTGPSLRTQEAQQRQAA